jgi:hypothetical protein
VVNRAVTRQNLGAWVTKCNPRSTPVEPFVTAGRTKSNWCVAANYRSQLIRSGDRVLFWVSAHPRRGIWGAGWVTSPMWVLDGRAHVTVAIPLFDEPLVAIRLGRLPELRSLEVLRAPQQANPSWVSTAELASLEPLLPTGARGDGEHDASGRATIDLMANEESSRAT